jgi:hypothetical protein
MPKTLKFPDHDSKCALNILEGERTRCSCPTIESISAQFGKAHEQESYWKGQMEKLRKQFFDLLKVHIKPSELARQTIFYEGDQPGHHVATLYPKWRIVTTRKIQGDEWQILIEEDPEKRSYTYLNPVDQQVYQRTVVESAPQVDLDKLKADHPSIYKSVTFQPKPPRELKSLDKLTDRQKDTLLNYLISPKLTNRMEKPRPAKPEELEENG